LRDEAGKTRRAGFEKEMRLVVGFKFISIDIGRTYLRAVLPVIAHLVDEQFVLLVNRSEFAAFFRRQAFELAGQNGFDLRDVTVDFVAVCLCQASFDYVFHTHLSPSLLRL
jgi:hypothetical protein